MLICTSNMLSPSMYPLRLQICENLKYFLDFSVFVRVARLFNFMPKIPVFYILKDLDWKLLINFMVIWHTSWTFGILCGHWFILRSFGIFSQFWYLYQENSGNPGLRVYSICGMAVINGPNQIGKKAGCHIGATGARKRKTCFLNSKPSMSIIRLMDNNIAEDARRWLTKATKLVTRQYGASFFILPPGKNVTPGMKLAPNFVP
jgi:hypothetical protein